MLKRWSHGLVGVVALVAAATAGVSSTQNQATVWNGVYSAPQAASGEKLYGTYCAACHGQDLTGIAAFA